jgi:hypothetical protein
MKDSVVKLLEFYACLMKLYPSRYRKAFSEERREVFAQALESASSRGNRALFRLVLRELHDLPSSAIRANLREWEVMMKKIENKLGDESLSWIGLLLGVWPFLFLGPLMAIMPYLPRQAARAINLDTPLWLAVVFLSLMVGIFVGWRKGFPRWVYPYLVGLFFVILVPILGRLSTLLGSNRLNPWIATAILLFVILGLGAMALFILGRLPPTRKILTDVRNDWTRLSFGMVVFLAFATGFYGGDHPPPFGLGVWLPSAVVVLGAVAYLLSRNRLVRGMVLIGTMGISFLGKFIFPTDDPLAIWPVLLILTMILSPVLLGLFPRLHITQSKER